MQFSRLLFCIVLLITPICLIGTIWLYRYPVFHGCVFPVPPSSDRPFVAPFRLLALGDPQLEGDSSLPKPGTPVFPSMRFLAQDVRRVESWRRRGELMSEAMKKAITKDLLNWIKGKRKAVDLWGNDYYLAHIVSSLRRYTSPTHVAVLGDLLGSQWVSDEEFERRAERFWGRVFRGMERVPDVIMEGDNTGADGVKQTWGRTLETLGKDKSWANRVINIVGNHDVGYAGDMSESRIERFERAFGKAHWEIVFEAQNQFYDDIPNSAGSPSLGLPPTLRLVILNSMNLDTPALSESLQTQTYDFMNHIIGTALPVTDKTHATILLTHIPLHKEPGICVDSPFFSFYQSGSGVKEQNMLSEHASKMILEGIFGLSGNSEAAGEGFGRKGIILNGHDHEGCDVVHYVTRPKVSENSFTDTDNIAEEINAELALSTSDIQEFMANTTSTSDRDEKEDTDPEPIPPQWHAHLTNPIHPSSPSNIFTHSSQGKPQIREITLRSMMGDFSGYAGFLSAWFDLHAGEHGEWKMEFATCGVGVQHWWWGVHIVDAIALMLLLLGAFVWVVERVEYAMDGGSISEEDKKIKTGAKKHGQKDRNRTVDMCENENPKSRSFHFKTEEKKF